MSVPVGQLMTPNTRNTAQGGLLASLNDLLNQQRNRAVQDDNLQRANLTRGLINSELGINPDADFKDFLGFKESQAKTGLLGAQTGLANARASEVVAAGDRAKFGFDQMKQGLVDQQNLNSAVFDLLGQGKLETQSRLLQELGGVFDQNGNFPHEQFVGGQALKELQQGDALSLANRQFGTQTGLLADRAKQLGGVQNLLSLQALRDQQPLKTESAIQLQNNASKNSLHNTLRGQNNQASNMNTLDVLKMERAEARQAKASLAFTEAFGLDIPPGVAQNLTPGDIAGMVQIKNAQITNQIQNLMSQRQAMFDEDGDPKSDEAAKAAEKFSDMIGELQRALITPAKTSSLQKHLDSVNEMLQLDQQQHQQAIEKAKSNHIFS